MANIDYVTKMSKIQGMRELLEQATTAIIAFSTVYGLDYDTAYNSFIILVHASLKQMIESGKADEMREEGERISQLIDELASILKR